MFVTTELLEKNGFKQTSPKKKLFLRESDGVLISFFGETNVRVSLPWGPIRGSVITFETVTEDFSGIYNFLRVFGRTPLHD